MAHRKNIYVTEQTATQLTALSEHYHSESAAIRFAVQLLWERHFAPSTEAGDALLQDLRQQLADALAQVDGEMERRTDG